MDPNQVLSEITELMQLTEAEAAKGGRLHKAGASAHGKTKAEHHGKMAEQYAKIADLHSALQDHYDSGAAGAHGKAEPKKTDGDEDPEGDDGDGEKATKSSGVASYGALEAVRNRPSRQQKPITRGEITEMLQDFGQNFAKSLVEIFRPPPEREPNADELAAARLLQARGYVIRTPNGAGAEPVHKLTAPVSTVVDTAPDRDKLGLEKTTAAASAAATDQEIEILKARIRMAEEKGPTADPVTLQAAAEARIKLDALAREEIRKAVRTPHVAADGKLAGYRGLPMADL